MPNPADFGAKVSQENSEPTSAKVSTNGPEHRSIRPPRVGEIELVGRGHRHDPQPSSHPQMVPHSTPYVQLLFYSAT